MLQLEVGCAARDHQSATLGGRALLGGGREGSIVGAIDIRAVLVLREGKREVKFAVHIPAGAGDDLGDGQIAGIAGVGVGHGGGRVCRDGAALRVGDGLDVAFRRVVRLGDHVGCVLRQAGELDGLTVLQAEGLAPARVGRRGGDVDAAALRARVAADEVDVRRSREGDGDVERLVRIKVVAIDGLADGQAADVASVLEGHGGVAAMRDLARGVGRRVGHVALGSVVLLGDGVLRARRDAGEGLRFAALEGEGGRGLVAGLAFCKRNVLELHAIVVVQRQRVVFEGDGEVERVFRLRAVAVGLLGDGQAAEVAGVGEFHPGHFVPRDRAGGVAGVRGGKARLRVGVLGHDVGRVHGEAGEGHFLLILEVEGVDAGGFLHEINGLVVLLEGLAREGFAVRVLQRQRESEGLVVPVIIAHDELLEAQAAGQAVGEGDQVLARGVLQRDDAVAGRVVHGGERIALFVQDLDVGGELAIAIGVREVHFDGVDAVIVDDVLISARDLTQFVDVVLVIARRQYVVVVERELREGEVALFFGGGLLIVGRGQAVGLRGQLEGVAGQVFIFGSALHNLLAVDGQLALGNVFVGDLYLVLHRAGHVPAGVGLEDEVLGASFETLHGQGRNTRVLARRHLKLAGGVVRAFRQALDHDVVGVGVEVVGLAGGEHSVLAVRAGLDGPLLYVRAVDIEVVAIERAVDVEGDVRHVQAVVAHLFDGEIARAHKAEVVAQVVRAGLEVEALGPPRSRVEVAVIRAGRVVLVIDGEYAAARLVLLGDDVAGRSGGGEPVGVARAVADEAGVVDVAVTAVLRAAVLRGGGVAVLEAVAAAAYRDGLTRGAVFHVGGQRQGDVGRGEAFAVILNAIGVLVDPDGIAEVNGLRHDSDQGVVALVLRRRAVIVHEGRAVDGHVVVDTLARGRLGLARGLAGVGQGDPRALSQRIDEDEEGVGVRFAVSREGGVSAIDGVKQRILALVAGGVVDLALHAFDGDIAYQGRAPGAVAIARVGQRVGDPEVVDVGRAVVDDLNGVLDLSARLDLEVALAAGGLASDGDELLDEQAAAAGDAVVLLGFEAKFILRKLAGHGRAGGVALVVGEGNAVFIFRVFGHLVGAVHVGRVVKAVRGDDDGHVLYGAGEGERQGLARHELALGREGDGIAVDGDAGLGGERAGSLPLAVLEVDGEAIGDDVADDGVGHAPRGPIIRAVFGGFEGDGVGDGIAAAGDGSIDAAGLLAVPGDLGILRNLRLGQGERGGDFGGGVGGRANGGLGGGGAADLGKVVADDEAGFVEDLVRRHDGSVVFLTGVEGEGHIAGDEARVDLPAAAVDVFDLEALRAIRHDDIRRAGSDRVGRGRRDPFAVHEEADLGLHEDGLAAIEERVVAVERRLTDGHDAREFPIGFDRSATGEELDVLIGEYGAVDRQGQLVEAAQRVGDILTVRLLQASHLGGRDGLGHFKAKEGGVGHVGEGGDGDAAILPDGHVLRGLPLDAIGEYGGGKVLMGNRGLRHGVGTGREHHVRHGDGVVDAVAIHVGAGRGIVGIARQLQIAGRYRIRATLGSDGIPLPFRVGDGEDGAFDQRVRIHEVALEDDDPALGHVVRLDVCDRLIRGDEEVVLAVHVRRLDLGRTEVDLRGACHVGAGRAGLDDVVALALRLIQLAQVGEGDLAVRAGGLGLNEGVGRIAILAHAVLVELEGGAGEYVGSRGIVREPAVLGEGDLDASLVDDGHVRRLSGVEGDLLILRRVVGVGGLGLGEEELGGAVRAGDDIVGQLDVFEFPIAAIDLDGRGVALLAPTAVDGVVVEFVVAGVNVVELELHLFGDGGVIVVYLADGEIGKSIDVFKGDHGGGIGIGVLLGRDGHGSAVGLCDVEPLVRDVLRFNRRAGDGVVRKPVALGALGDFLDGVGLVRVRGQLDGLRRHGGGQGDFRDLLIVLIVDLELNAVLGPLGLVGERLLDGQQAVAVVHKLAGGVGRAAEGFTEGAVEDFEHLRVGKHVVFVVVAFKLGQLVPAGNEAFEGDGAVFVGDEVIRVDGDAGLVLNIAGDGGRRRGGIKVVLGEGGEVQRELHAHHGFARVILLGDGEGAGAGVFQLKLLDSLIFAEGKGLLIEKEEVALFGGGEFAAFEMGLDHGVGTGGEGLIDRHVALAGVGGGDGGKGSAAGGGALVDGERRNDGLIVGAELLHLEGALLDVDDGGFSVYVVGRLGIRVGRERSLVRRLGKVGIQLIAGRSLLLGVVVGGIRLEGEVRLAARVGDVGVDERIFAIAVAGVDGDLRARERGGRGLIHRAAMLGDDHGNKGRHHVYDGAVLAFAIGVFVPDGVALAVGLPVVRAVGGDVHQVFLLLRRGVGRPLGLDEEEVGGVFGLAVVFDLLDGIVFRVDLVILIVEIMHLDGLGDGLAGGIIISRIIRHVHAGGEIAGDEFDTISVSVGEVDVEGGVGKRLFTGAIHVHADLVQLELEVAEDAFAAVGRVVLHLLRDEAALTGRGIKRGAEAALERIGKHIAIRGLDLVEPVDVAAGERTGDDVARASVRRRAGFVDVFAHPVGELEVVLQILFARRFFPCIIVLNGAAVEVELGVIDGALVQRRFIDPAVLRIVVFRLGFIGVEFALLIVELIHLELDIRLHVLHGQRVREGRLVGQVDGHAVVVIQSIRKGHALDLINGAKRPVVRGLVAIVVAQLEHGVGGGAVQMLEGGLAVLAGLDGALSYFYFVELAVLNDEQRQLRIGKREGPLVAVEFIPLGIPGLADGDGILRDVVDGDLLRGGSARVAAHEFDILRFIVEDVALGLRGLHHGVGERRLAVSLKSGQVANGHARGIGNGGDGLGLHVGLFRLVEAKASVGEQVNVSRRKGAVRGDGDLHGRAREVFVLVLAVPLDDGQRGEAGGVVDGLVQRGVRGEFDLGVGIRRGDDARRPADFLDVIGSGLEGEGLAVGEGGQVRAKAVLRHLYVFAGIVPGAQFKGEVLFGMRRAADLLGDGEGGQFVVFEGGGGGLERFEGERGGELTVRPISGVRAAGHGDSTRGKIAGRDGGLGDGVFAGDEGGAVAVRDRRFAVFVRGERGGGVIREGHSERRARDGVAALILLGDGDGRLVLLVENGRGRLIGGAGGGGEGEAPVVVAAIGVLDRVAVRAGGLLNVVLDGVALVIVDGETREGGLAVFAGHDGFNRLNASGGHLIVDGEGDARLGFRSSAKLLALLEDDQVRGGELVDEVGGGGEGGRGLVVLIPEIELDGVRLEGVVGGGGIRSGRGFLYLIVVGNARVARGGKVLDGRGEATVVGEGDGAVGLFVVDGLPLRVLGALIDVESEAHVRVYEIGVFIVELLVDGQGAVLLGNVRDLYFCGGAIALDGDGVGVVHVVVGVGFARLLCDGILGPSGRGGHDKHSLTLRVGLEGFIIVIRTGDLEGHVGEGIAGRIRLDDVDDARGGNGVDEGHRVVAVGVDRDVDRRGSRLVRAGRPADLLDAVVARLEVLKDIGRAAFGNLHGDRAVFDLDIIPVHALLIELELDATFRRGESGGVEGIIIHGLTVGIELELLDDGESAAGRWDAVGARASVFRRIFRPADGRVGDLGGVVKREFIRLTKILHERRARVVGGDGVFGVIGGLDAIVECDGVYVVDADVRTSTRPPIVRAGRSGGPARRGLTVDGGQGVGQHVAVFLEVERAVVRVGTRRAIEVRIGGLGDLDRPLDGNGVARLGDVAILDVGLIHRPLGGSAVGHGGIVVFMIRAHRVGKFPLRAIRQHHRAGDGGGEFAVGFTILGQTIVGHIRGDREGHVAAEAARADGVGERILAVRKDDVVRRGEGHLNILELRIGVLDLIGLRIGEGDSRAEFHFNIISEGLARRHVHTFRLHADDGKLRASVRVGRHSVLDRFERQRVLIDFASGVRRFAPFFGRFLGGDGQAFAVNLFLRQRGQRHGAEQHEHSHEQCQPLFCDLSHRVYLPMQCSSN